MGNIINKKILIDEETGEVLRERSWFGYDGFNEKGYNYRRLAVHIRYYFDAIPSNLSKDAFFLLFMIAELMNEENVLIYKIKRKSKFSSIIYKPMDKDYIAQNIRFKYGQNKFDKCWKELAIHCLKKIKYHDVTVWAVNPAVISKCKYIPIWLYEEFNSYMNPFLSATAIKKLENKVKSQYE